MRATRIKKLTKRQKNIEFEQGQQKRREYRTQHDKTAFFYNN